MRRRWALLFLNVMAGLALAPFIYWDGILMRVVFTAAHDGATLLGLTVLSGLGGFILLLFAALGLGGCMHALRRVMTDNYAFLPTEFAHGVRHTAKTSLVAGMMVALSLMVMRTGLVNLYTQPPLPTLLQPVLTIILVLQLLILLPWGLLMLCQDDNLQRHPARTMAAAASTLANQPLCFALLLGIAVLPILFFSVQQPWLKFLGFFCVLLFALAPVMLLWQRSVRMDANPPGRRNRRPYITLAVLAALSTIAIIAPALGQSRYIARTTLGETLAFLLRQVTLEADNATVRSLLAASSVWPWLAAALLGTACLILVTYACACYRFRGRGLLFIAAVALQLWPMLSRYSALEQLLRNMSLPLPPSVAIILWAGLYLLVALLLLRKFTRMLPQLRKTRCRVKYPGARLFFYYALPRARLAVIALTLLTTLGSWPDVLAPFWHMQELGVFSLVNFIVQMR